MNDPLEDPAVESMEAVEDLIEVSTKGSEDTAEYSKDDSDEDTVDDILEDSVQNLVLDTGDILVANSDNAISRKLCRRDR